MRRVVVLAFLALALPIAAWANGIDLTNEYGNVTVTSPNGGAGTIGVTTISSNQSQLKSFNGISSGTHSLGSVTFSTGVLLTGSLSGGGTFSGTGSSFVVKSNGSYGVPKGTLFSGSFVGPIDWTLTSAPGAKNLVYTLSGTIQGTYDGRMITGTTTQTIYTVADQLNQGIGHVRTGSTSLSIPEPGTLGLLGTGLVGIAGMFRRKLIGS
jgi:hypothetical protein